MTRHAINSARATDRWLQQSKQMFPSICHTYDQEPTSSCRRPADPLVDPLTCHHQVKEFIPRLSGHCYKTYRCYNCGTFYRRMFQRVDQVTIHVKVQDA